jgi:hypothetical protein
LIAQELPNYSVIEGISFWAIGNASSPHPSKSMQVVIQGVKSCLGTVEGRVVGQIAPGINLLVAISDRDTETETRLDGSQMFRIAVISQSPGRYSSPK